MSASAGKINLAWDLSHPPAKVWQALTDPALMAQWLMTTDMPAQTGQAFTFQTGMEPTPFWDGIVHSKILELEPQRRLRYSWKTGSGAAGLDTVVTWSLVPTDSGTRLELEHSGFKAENGQAFGGAKYGWERNVGERLAGLLKSLN